MHKKQSLLRGASEKRKNLVITHKGKLDMWGELKQSSIPKSI